MPALPPVFGQKPPKARKGGSYAKRDRSAAYARMVADILTAEPLCRYCRADNRITPAAIGDHRLALSLGGTNDPDNIVPACEPCNSAKAKAEARYVARGYDPAFARFDPDLSLWFRLADSIPAIKTEASLP